MKLINIISYVFKKYFRRLQTVIHSQMYNFINIIYEYFIRVLHAYKNKWKFLSKSLAEKSLIIFCLAGAAAETAQWNS